MALAMAMVLDIMECGIGQQKKITNSDRKGRRRHFWEDTEGLGTHLFTKAITSSHTLASATGGSTR